MNKRIEDELDDLPELTDEMLAELKQKPVDLHLGPAKVKPIDRNAWMKEFGPRPKGPGIYALDVLTVALGCVLLYFMLNAWIYVFS